MVSSGALRGDHSDDMSRSMMGNQLERGNSSSTREVRDARVRLPPASLESLETRDRSEAMQYDIAGWREQWARLPDTTIHTTYSYVQKSVHDRFVSDCLSPLASPNAALPML